jgi:hypothetical protein
VPCINNQYQSPANTGAGRFLRKGAESDSQLALSTSLPENQNKYDDEDKDANRDIHNMLSFLMMAYPSPFTDYRA